MKTSLQLANVTRHSSTPRHYPKNILEKTITIMKVSCVLLRHMFEKMHQMYFDVVFCSRRFSQPEGALCIKGTASTACSAYLSPHHTYRPSNPPTCVSEQTYLDIYITGTSLEHPRTITSFQGIIYCKAHLFLSEEQYISRSIYSSHEAAPRKEVLIYASHGISPIQLPLLFLIISYYLIREASYPTRWIFIYHYDPRGTCFLITLFKAYVYLLCAIRNGLLLCSTR